MLMAEPQSCPFAPRCAHVFERCRRENPPRLPVGPAGHDAACWWDAQTGEPRHVA